MALNPKDVRVLLPVQLILDCHWLICVRGEGLTDRSIIGMHATSCQREVDNDFHDCFSTWYWWTSNRDAWYVDNTSFFYCYQLILNISAFNICNLLLLIDIGYTFTLTFTFSHLADAFIQSDLQMRTKEAINQQKSNNIQSLWQVSISLSSRLSKFFYFYESKQLE